PRATGRAKCEVGVAAGSQGQVPTVSASPGGHRDRLWASTSHTARARPERDRDRLQHAQGDAREANAPVPFWMLALEVQNGPEEDRDHLYHPYQPQDDAREADTYRPARMLSLKVQNGPEEDRDHVYHS
uniref:Uncharacterized protein n=1 Tax=Ficedula albicollis TaxID=59894 RepID=A0A803VNZ8_FICAL